MSNHNWEAFGYRVIPEWSNYIMSPQLDVWSVPRRVRCKGGKTREIAARQLKKDDGRVSLSQYGKVKRFHVRRELYPLVFADMISKPQAFCQGRGSAGKRHPLMELLPDVPDVIAKRIGKPEIREWGTGNRICLRCYDPPETFADDNQYSEHFGSAGMPEYSNTPAQPKPRIGGRMDLEALEWMERGFIVTQHPWGVSAGENSSPA